MAMGCGGSHDGDMKRLGILSMLVFLWIAPGAGAAGMRTWTDATGKHKVEAELIDFSGEEITLRNADGKTKTLGLDSLSVADRAVAYEQIRELVLGRFTPAERHGFEALLELGAGAQIDPLFKIQIGGPKVTDASIDALEENGFLIVDFTPQSMNLKLLRFHSSGWML